MSKRLQVLMDEEELEVIRRAALDEGLSLSEWVREVLRAARRHRARGDPKTKLDVIRAAVAHGFPAPDIEQMNAEITSGYGSGWEE